MLDAVFATYLVEAMDTVARNPANTILGQIGKLDALWLPAYGRRSGQNCQ